MRTVVVVQARTGSTRLPAKVLLPLAGAPLLARMLERVRAAATPFDLVVATTHDPADDPVVALCTELGVHVHRGHPTDLLDRHVTAARAHGADVVVKIPSDCPLVDPAAIDRVLGAFFAAPDAYDFVSNLHPATWPDGHDVEVMTMAALETAWREARKPHEREHTTPFLWDRPGRFRCANVPWETGRDLSMTHRMTVDWPCDYELVAAVYDALYRPERPITAPRSAPPRSSIFGLGEILDFLERRPDVFALNAKYAGVNWYRHHLADLATVRARETRCEPT